MCCLRHHSDSKDKGLIIMGVCIEGLCADAIRSLVPESTVAITTTTTVTAALVMIASYSVIVLWSKWECES